MMILEIKTIKHGAAFMVEALLSLVPVALLYWVVNNGDGSLFETLAALYETGRANVGLVSAGTLAVTIAVSVFVFTAGPVLRHWKGQAPMTKIEKIGWFVSCAVANTFVTVNLLYGVEAFTVVVMFNTLAVLYALLVVLTEGFARFDLGEGGEELAGRVLSIVLVSRENAFDTVLDIKEDLGAAGGTLQFWSKIGRTIVAELGRLLGLKRY